MTQRENKALGSLSSGFKSDLNVQAPFGRGGVQAGGHCEDR